MTLYHKQIINWLKPAAEWMRECVPFPPLPLPRVESTDCSSLRSLRLVSSVHSTPGGWAIPIGVFIIISFPPLFGHEVVGILYVQTLLFMSHASADFVS